MLDRILRVDHAGEYGANRIYAGQMAVLGRSRVGPLIQEMWDQEKKHLEKFNEILAENRVRPTALLPLWNIAGFALGASSALLGKEGAMACTVAVEESISEHYNSQIRALMEKDPERYIELLNVIKEFRDDEMEHHDTGLAHDAETAFPSSCHINVCTRSVLRRRLVLLQQRDLRFQVPKYPATDELIRLAPNKKRFIPYCSSDVWSGTGPAPTPPPRPRQGREKERERSANATEYTFMGSLIIREVIKDLIPKGIKQAKVVMLSGSSAGGTGVLLNIERVASQLEQLGAEAQVRGLVDSGWFIESKQQRSPNCPETVSCSPEDAIKIGLRLWNGVVPDRCRQLYKKGEEWQCFFGHRLYSTLTSPLFVVQWLFDEEQLRVENIYIGGQSLSEVQWQYIQNLGTELKNSLRDVTAVFAPSCLSHTVLTKSNWMSYQVRGTSLPRALHCWDRSLEATRNNRTPAKGCPFHLVDTCQWPQCNPTCPALVDQATQQELTLLQMLVAMGLDLQRLGLDPQGDEVPLASMVSNGG
ncbi:hypothetical protein F2P81_010663 [Scophthalmus maximus]|uniref:5-demethoxyubiquinone hydroxylase, mitochondrial n=1 Tax=Scophthalmus maximus TaxID=52904 RepID=A0A6A4SYJ5_SCOMX|nr:hypothetical protein F2P81_010663 [Scophthalmus maximus]